MTAIRPEKAENHISQKGAPLFSSRNVATRAWPACAGDGWRVSLPGGSGAGSPCSMLARARQVPTGSGHQPLADGESASARSSTPAGRAASRARAWRVTLMRACLASGPWRRKTPSRQAPERGGRSNQGALRWAARTACVRASRPKDAPIVAHGVDVGPHRGQRAPVQVTEQAAPPDRRTISASTRPGVTPCSRRTARACAGGFGWAALPVRICRSWRSCRSRGSWMVTSIEAAAAGPWRRVMKR